MARPLRIEYPGAFYHITARGNERKDIFKGAQDYEKFLSYLEASTQRYGAIIHVYCLMGNHYHLLLETPLGNLSQIMRHINGSYTTYFNTRRKRAGHLFQGRYKAILVDADGYAGGLSRYIHLNPLRAGLSSRPEHYRWSSYQYYIGKKRTPEWLKLDFILGYFGRRISTAQNRYHEFVNALVDKEYVSPLKDTLASTILGGFDFVNEIKDKYLSSKELDRNLPALTELLRGPSLEEISNVVKAKLSEDPVLLKKATLYLCHRYSGRTLKEIGAHFGIGESAVSQASSRFRLMLDKSIKLRKKIDTISKKLKM